MSWREGTMLARNGEAIEVFGWEPGNGTRYDLTFAKRSGGGWFVAWPEAGLVGLIRPGHDSVFIEPRGKDWPEADVAAVAELATELYDGGSL
jgi:hypothetical protein